MVLLKLIQARFFLEEGSLTTIWASYLTYFAYIVLGMFAAVMLIERDLPRQKSLRDAFILGLLAPSTLFAIIREPIRPAELPEQSQRGVPEIPALSRQVPLPAEAPAPGGEVEAREVKAKGQQLEAERGEKFEAKASEEAVAEKEEVEAEPRELKERDVERGFGDAILQAMGRSRPSTAYVLAVGGTRDAAKACEAAGRINTILTKGRFAVPPANVVRPEGRTVFYVIIGGLGTAAKAAELRSAVKSIAEEECRHAADPSAKNVALLLSDSRIVKGQSLFGQ